MKLLPTANDSRRVLLWALLAAVSLSWLAQGAAPEATAVPASPALPPVVIELPPVPTAIPSAIPPSTPAPAPPAAPPAAPPETLAAPAAPPAASSVVPPGEAPAMPPVVPPPVPAAELPPSPPVAGQPPPALTPPASLAPQAVDIFSVRTWQPPPPPVDLNPGPPPKPQAPPLPFKFLGKIDEPDRDLTFLLARGDQVIPVNVGQVINGIYFVEKYDAGRLYFIYKPLKTRQSISVGRPS